MMVCCIEVDKRGEEPPAYYVVTKDPTAELLAQLRFRQFSDPRLKPWDCENNPNTEQPKSFEGYVTYE